MRFIFDTIIFLLLFSTVYWMYVIIRSFFYDKKNEVKTKIIRICFLVFLFFCFLILTWGSFIEPRIIKVEETNVNIEAPLQYPIKIALLTDLHVGPYKKNGFVQRIVDKTLTAKPDIVLLGGDYILNREENAYHLLPLKELADKIPTYAVTGNHEFNSGRYDDPHYEDKTKTLRELFNAWGIPILDNETLLLELNNQRINVAGVADLWTGKDDLPLVISKMEKNYPSILISHNPDIILREGHENFDLILSGHTHAGQIRLPYIGSVPNIPDELGRAYDMGLFKLKNGYLYISRGLGESGTRARLFSPPELSIITVE